MKISVPRLRNLTTGLIHTEMTDMYIDLQMITSNNNVTFNDLLPLLAAVQPWLRRNVTYPKFWDGIYDPAHIGEIELPDPTQEEQSAMYSLYMESARLPVYDAPSFPDIAYMWERLEM